MHYPVLTIYIEGDSGFECSERGGGRSSALESSAKVFPRNPHEQKSVADLTVVHGVHQVVEEFVLTEPADLGCRPPCGRQG